MIIDGPDAGVERVRRLLHGEIIDGVVLAPPPAQTAVPVWPTPYSAVSLPERPRRKIPACQMTLHCGWKTRSCVRLLAHC